MFNLVVLTGRLTADPELRYTSGNIPVTSFSIAVNRRYKAGEESQADFINIVAWRQTAEFVTKYFQKGSLIGIEGSIQTRRYVDKDTGKNRTAFEVIANNVQFVESKRDSAAPVAEPAAFSNNIDGDFSEIAGDDDLPF
ncbi:MAG: single-stranded DNA-binding protein [Clostridia bacterium]|nr:single-stranded DNA-binding protein [Clostridia bacterium]